MARHLVRDLMTPDVMTLRPWQSVLAAYDAMLRKNIRHAPVLDESGSLVGLLTQRDIAKRAMYPTDEVSPVQQRESLNLLHVDEVMTKGIATASPYDSLSRAAAIMLEKKFGCLPVIADGDLVGILTEADFVEHVLALEVAEDQQSPGRFDERPQLQALA